MKTSSPVITSITPTHGRSELTMKMLKSLADSAIEYSGQLEIIIIDSSKGEEAQKIKNTCLLYNAKYVVGSESVREKRNIGAKIASGHILLFIDSDCAASSDLLAEHAKCYLEHPEIAGVCGITEFNENNRLHLRIVELTGMMDAFSFAKKYDQVQWCTTSNLSIRKDIFWEEGGFDEKFPFRLGGDDLDLTYRITNNGGRIMSNPKAVVSHAPMTWARFSVVMERAYRWGRMGYHVFNKHKQLQYFDLPKPMAVLFFIVGLYFLKAGFREGWSKLWVVVLALSFFLIIEITVLSQKADKWKRLIIPFSWVYVLIYRTGFILEFLKHFNLRFIYQKTLFSFYQLVDEWPANVKRQWTMMICFIGGWSLWMMIR
jgi:GT2 family glycosyltransferase